MGGVHGGNRLGSIALTEIFVFGLRAGSAAATAAKNKQATNASINERKSSSLVGAGGKNRPLHLSRKLQEIMWNQAGLVKDKEGLLAALEAAAKLEEDAKNLHICNETAYNMELCDAYELTFMLTTAKLILTAALLREESRGAHLDRKSVV